MDVDDFLLTKKEKVEKYVQKFYKAKQESKREDLELPPTVFGEES